MRVWLCLPPPAQLYSASKPFRGWYYCEKHALRMSAAALDEF